MKSNVTMQNEDHLFTSEDKMSWFGYGEWVEEPDIVEFTYKGHQCKVFRVVAREPYARPVCMFGGHLCGYVRVPADHPYHYKKFEDMEIDCHHGLTWGECSNGHWIGFDCAHSTDYVPSMEKLKRTDESLIAIRQMFPIPEQFRDLALFNPTYKNVNYCIEECKGIVDQLIVIAEAFESEDQKPL